MKTTGDFNIVIGKRIKHLRLKNDMTQMDLAALMNFKSSGIISQIENGERGLKRDNIFKAADIFMIEPAVLMAKVDIQNEDLDIHVAFSKLVKQKEIDEKSKNYYDLIKKILEETVV